MLAVNGWIARYLERHPGMRVVAAAPRFAIDNHLGVRDMAAAGLGIALLPDFQAAPLVESGRLKPLLEGWHRRPATVYAAFAPTRHGAAAVRAVRAVARETFGEGDG